MLFAALVLIVRTPAVEVTIDATTSTPISPYIYGANFPKWNEMPVPFTLARLGGNRTTAYNWETNASNAGNDWHHQNDGYMDESNEPGHPYRLFLEEAQHHGAAVLLTIPTAGHVSADKKGDGDVAQTPDYLNTRFYKSLAKKNGPLSYPPDTTDKVVYQDEFAAWLWKTKSDRTPLWFSLDNEPDLWQSTHERIVPKNVGYAGIIANNIDFAGSLKQVAPKALIFGPANYGWQGFRAFQDAPDAAGRNFLDVYLAAMNAAEKKAGKRLLDVLDVHWYPEARGDGVRITSNDDKPGIAAARIQAPRSLWDPAYVEDSWIADTLGNKPITLLPMLKAQVAKNYPGTKLAITEYNYGGGQSVSGLLAQADVLGIFGRYGLFAACNWGIGPTDWAQLAGFRAFLDYDGRGGHFGDRALPVTGGAASEISVYASADSHMPGQMVIVAINKLRQSRELKCKLTGFSAQRVDGHSFHSTVQSSPLPAQVESGAITATLPEESVIVLKIRK